MKTFTGIIKTDKVGSDTEFTFEVEDNASEEEIAYEAREAAFNFIDWSYWEDHGANEE